MDPDRGHCGASDCLICHIDYPMLGESEADWLVRVGKAYRAAPPLYRQTDQDGQAQKQIVLEALRKGGWIKLRVLCEAIDARMDRVYNVIRELRKEGYQIETGPPGSKVYRLLEDV